MKRILALTLTVLMVFALVACGSSKNNEKVEKYVEENKAELISTMEESFATSSGMTCSSSVEVEGSGFIITIKINELDDVDSDTKEQMQTAYDAMDGTFKDALEMMQSELPELEYFEVEVCEKDGDLIATIHAEN